MVNIDSLGEKYSKEMRERLKKYGSNIGRKRFNEWKEEQNANKRTETS